MSMATMNTSTVVNLDFLRSGRTFTNAGEVVDLSARERAHSVNERLEKYHHDTLAAVEDAIEGEQLSKDFKIRKNEPKSILNVGFLRSGAEFTEPRLVEPAEHAKHVIRTETERLANFHAATLKAVARAPLPATAEGRRRTNTIPGPNTTSSALFSSSVVTSLAKPALTINVGFLKSGQQFSPPPMRRSATGGRGEPAQEEAGGEGGETMSPKSRRLEEFHRRTAAAMAASARAGLLPKQGR